MKTLIASLMLLTVLSGISWAEIIDIDNEVAVLNSRLQDIQAGEKQLEIWEEELEELRQSIIPSSHGNDIVLGGGFSYTRNGQTIWPGYREMDGWIKVPKFHMRKKDGYWAYPKSCWGTVFEIKGQRACWITKRIYKTLPSKIRKVFKEWDE